ncbi:unnamed protein product [Linum trigynum]|uniref:AP2/ERF domain-containing protein n=1 Tax=Linum trigynum TaxID=586398 RepID=A0AAV2EN99_9ROSI
MSKRKIPSSNNYFPAASVSAPDLNLDILLHPNTTPYLAAAAKKLRSSSESPAQSTMMDARVPDRDFPDEDGNDSDSSSDIINTEIEPFPRSLNSIPAASSAFAFDILRKEGSIPTTHQLFPERTGPELNPPAAAPDQWLKLSEAEASPPAPAKQAVQPRKSRRGPRSRSSQYRGVTFYRRTGRWESHIWDCGKQVYLGGFDTAHAAARAYDRAAIKFRGVDADINFTLTDYDEDMKALKDLGKEEFVQVLRRQTTGFSRGSSKYRGGATVQKSGQWEARMAQLLVNNKAYDKTTIGYSGTATPTNIQPREFDTNASGRGEDDLDLRLGISSSSPNSTAPNGKKVDKATTSSSSRAAAGPFGFQPLHGLPINIASNTLQTWPPPPSPSPSTFDPETRGSWAHHNQLTGVVVNSDGVPKWPASSSSQQVAAASSGFLSSSSNNTNNVNRPSAYMAAGGGSSSSSPNVSHFFQPSSNQYWYSHKREQ